jgi:hypothetical protein
MSVHSSQQKEINAGAISAHGMSRTVEDAIMYNSDGNSSGIQFTSHNVADAVSSSQPPFLSNVHAAIHQQNPIADEGSEESPTALRSPLPSERGSPSGQCRNVAALPSVEDNSEDEAGVEKAENSRDVLTLSRGYWLARQLVYS